MQEETPCLPLLPVGTITKAHGIRGEVCVMYYADSPHLLDGPLYLESASGATTPIAATSWRVDRDRLLLRLEGIEERNAAEKLRGCRLLIPETSLPPPNEGEVYLHSLMQAAVFSLEEGEKKAIGKLTAVSFPAGQEIWTITTPEGKEILFPAVADFVLDMDPAAGTILISPPPGLLELYL